MLTLTKPASWQGEEVVITRTQVNGYAYDFLGKGETVILAFTLMCSCSLLFFFLIHSKVCKQLPPCPLPLAPRNGGLVCVTIGNAQYCKPMCNKVMFMVCCGFVAGSIH